MGVDRAALDIVGIADRGNIVFPGMNNHTGRAQLRQSGLHIRRQGAQLDDAPPGIAGQTRGRAVAAVHLLDHARAQGLVLDAVGRCLHEDAVAADAQQAEQRQQERQLGIGRNAPAVIAKGGGQRADAGHLVGMALGHGQ